MTISINGLGNSGFDFDTMIKGLVNLRKNEVTKVSNQAKAITKQGTTLSDLKTNYNDLLSSIKKFTETFSKDNVFNQKTAKSSSEDITAKVDSTATVQSLKVSVTSLASATTAKSAFTVGSYVDDNTKLSDIAAGALTNKDDVDEFFSIYVGGKKNVITVDPSSGETLGHLVGRIDAIDGVSASLANGKLTISGTGVVVGSTSDTSNFSSVMSLNTNGSGTYSSSKSIFDTNTSAALKSTTFRSSEGADVSVSEGTFTIGSAMFTIGANTSLDQLIADINDSDAAGVSAYWDKNAGKLVLTSKDEGAININIEKGSSNFSNFTEIMGLTDDNGLLGGSQTLGSNAVLKVNNTEITSISNTVTSDISGIRGLTLTLNKETTTDAKVDITSDSKALSDAITEFVNAFNTVITNTDSATGSTKIENENGISFKYGDLYGDSILNSLRKQIRTTATATVTGEDGYKSLANIGITTGKIGTESNDVSKLEIDADKLASALEKDPESVMKMLIGDSSTSTEGVFTKLETILDKSLDPAKGYFTKSSATFDKQAKRLNDKVKKMNVDLEKYESDLRKKYDAVDSLLSSYQKSASVFSSYFSNKSQNNS